MGNVVDTATIATIAATACSNAAAAPFLNLICRIFYYPCWVHGNMRGLELAIVALIGRREGVERDVENGEHRDQEIMREVEVWIGQVKAIESKVEEMKQMYESRCRCFGDLSFQGFLNWSESAADLLSGVEKLRKEGANFQGVTREAPPPTVLPASIGSTSTQTAISNLEKAREYINDSNVGVIGIWGMGGVGKTHLLNSIINNYRQDTSFDFVVSVTASKDCSVEKIQTDIIKAHKLNEKNENRKFIIFKFLHKKNFLLLVDDLWERVDLEEVGIPFPLGAKCHQYKRKVVLTTRSVDICGEMEVSKKIEVLCLNPDESLSLFRDKVGDETLNSHHEIPKLAQKVVNELGGLPLALIIIGRAMSNRKTIQNWDDTIEQLQESNSKLTENVHEQLQLSYEYLPRQTLKDCFLSCSLWPEDHPFEENDLIQSWIGLGYIKEYDNIQSAYRDGRDIIRELLQRCLLEKYHDISYLNGVKMHDVIRDMAYWIARDFGKNNNKWIIKTGGLTKMPNDEKCWCDAEYISFMNNNFSAESRSVLSSPSNLTTLLLPNNKLGIFPINSLYLTNLQYLNLASNKISIIPPEICKLINLQCLNLSDNYPIISIPTELKALTNLKFLYLKRCNINYFPKEVILALESLEFLDLSDSATSIIFDNSSFVEGLKSLRNLKALGISIYSPMLETFNGLPLHSLFVVIPAGQGYLLEKPFSINSNFSTETYRYLVELWFSCGVLLYPPSQLCKYFVIEGEEGFPKLEKLTFIMMPNLRDIVWRGVLPKDVFPRLQVLVIMGCAVKHITWIAQLPRLEILMVDSCNNIKELVRSNEGSSSTSQRQSRQEFRSLKSIILIHLKKLESICDPDYYTFPSLRYLSIYNCPGCKKFPFPNGIVPSTVKLNTNQLTWK